jgi:hypothetical protein
MVIMEMVEWMSMRSYRGKAKCIIKKATIFAFMHGVGNHGTDSLTKGQQSMIKRSFILILV